MRKKVYRFLGISIRHVLGPNEHTCIVVELQHRASGDLYHYHKDVPAGGISPLVSLIEVMQIADGKTVKGWDLQEPLGEEARALALENEIRDFILWLTPCGECEPCLSVETIGKLARKLYAKIRR